MVLAVQTAWLSGRCHHLWSRSAIFPCTGCLEHHASFWCRRKGRDQAALFSTQAWSILSHRWTRQHSCFWGISLVFSHWTTKDLGPFRNDKVPRKKCGVYGAKLGASYAKSLCKPGIDKVLSLPEIAVVCHLQSFQSLLDNMKPYVQPLFVVLQFLSLFSDVRQAKNLNVITVVKLALHLPSIHTNLNRFCHLSLWMLTLLEPLPPPAQREQESCPFQIFKAATWSSWSTFIRQYWFKLLSS